MAADPAPRRLLYRVLHILPIAIAALWIAGIAQFRNLGFRPIDYGAVLAAAFALHIVLGRTQRRRAPIVLPAGSNPAVVAVLAGLITGSIGLVLGGIAEQLAPTPTNADLPPWWLRTLWHGACAFAASYCRFLCRLLPLQAARQG